jgi:(1->4)-alpha-D-glucan 1-alpha-D-glucosylmutase
VNIPTATYRLQFNPEFGFQHAGRIAGYLADLGVSHIYASPIFKARKGSPHGYDIVDPNQLNPELESGCDFQALHRKLVKYNIRWIQDIVPNHMAFDFANRMLMDVLENGSFSSYYDFFDIDWHPPQKAMQKRVMAPFLGCRLEQCLIEGELKLSIDPGGLAVNYYHLKLPLRIESWPKILEPICATLRKKLGDHHKDYANFAHLVKDLENLSLSERPENRHHIQRIKSNLKNFCDANTMLRHCVEEELETYHQKLKKGKGLEEFGRLLSGQIFALCCWKVAGDQINYRRFFDINELICLRQEDRKVFVDTHALLKRLVRDGYVNGVRIDHIDGLADPAGYLQQLRDQLGNIYILVEKILEPEESLPASWPVQGSTGYDFTFRLNGLFCAAENQDQFNSIYQGFIGRTANFEHILYHSKRQFLNNQLGGDLNNLARRIKEIADQTPWGCDMTYRRVKESLAELLSRFTAYRTYINRKGPSMTDRILIQRAEASAIRHRPELTPELTFIRRLLLEKMPDSRCKEHLDKVKDVEEIIMKFQQLSAPMTAKGFEDTAIYVYNRLVSLNEVGGDPREFGGSVNAFHEFIKTRFLDRPHTMNSTATHDSKRGEDVRARINVLSELPGEWERYLNHWHALNQKMKIRINGREIPDPNEECLLYQTLLGTFPFERSPDDLFIERISQYLVKALREAKIHSSWTQVNHEYETALVSFAQNILDPVQGGPFLNSFLPFFKKIASYGIWNSLSQTLIKITAPGVPDFYQGTELFDFRLVDPDNRQPVDFDLRKRYLAQIRAAVSSDPLDVVRELVSHRRDGRIKLFLTARALRTRNRHAELFQRGTYVPLAAAGSYKDHVIAFARTHAKHCSIIVGPRLLTGMITETQSPLGERVWGDTEIILPDTKSWRWKNMFTQEMINPEPFLKIGNVLQHFPCALLIKEDTE